MKLLLTTTLLLLGCVTFGIISYGCDDDSVWNFLGHNEICRQLWNATLTNVNPVGHNSEQYPSSPSLLLSKILSTSRKLLEFDDERTLDSSVTTTTSSSLLMSSKIAKLKKKSVFAKKMFDEEGATGYYELRAPSKLVPSKADTYLGYCINLNNITQQINVTLSAQEIIIIGYEPIITRPYNAVHHFELEGSSYDYYDPTTWKNGSEPITMVNCRNATLPGYTALMWVWTRLFNDPPIALRDDTSLPGFPTTFGPDSTSHVRTIRLRLHYDQPGDRNEYDQTGVRIYYNYSYTNTCPRHDECIFPFQRKRNNGIISNIVSSAFGFNKIFGKRYLMSNPITDKTCQSLCVGQPHVAKKKGQRYVCGNRCP